MTWTRRDWIYLLSLTLLAAALRFYKLGEVPPGFQFDEAFNAIDAEQVWYGNRPLFLPANGGREVLYTYVQALVGSFLGFHVYSLRLVSALAGIATVPAAYLLIRRILQRESQPVALFTALTLTVSFWHLHFSHYGIRVIMMPLLLSGLFGACWLSYHSHRPRTIWLATVIAGLLTGLSVWTHPSGRFTPFVLLGYTLWLLWRHPERRRWQWSHPLVKLALMGLIAFVVFLPLGFEFYRHPEFFFGHASEVSIFAERVRGEAAPWQVLLEHLLLVLGMFSFTGDGEWIHNLPGRPVLEAPLALFFALGVLRWGRRLFQRQDPDQNALVLLAGWTLVMLLPSVLSDAAPNYSRTLPALPAVFVAAGLGLSWLATGPQRWQSRQTATTFPQWSGYALASVLVAGSGLWAAYDYFVRFPQAPDAYYHYDADKLDALTALNDLAAQGNTVYLEPLWSEHSTFTFLRDRAIIKSLDTSQTFVLPPPGQGAVYAFPAEKIDRAQSLARAWPGVNATELHDRYDRPLLVLVQLTPDQARSWPQNFAPDAISRAPTQPTSALPVAFNDAPRLLGYQQRNDKTELVLFWQAEGQTLRDLTAFLHLMDQDGRRVAQIDRLPGDGSYRTPTWAPGERVIERYYPKLQDQCAGDDPLWLLVGWYELAADGARRPLADGTGDAAVLGPVTLPSRAYAPDQITLPARNERIIAPGLTLLADALISDTLPSGSTFVLDLYWQASAALATTPVQLSLQWQTQPVPLWEDRLAPDIPWHEGEIICRRLRMTLPAALPAGTYPLQLHAAENSVTVRMLTVTP